MQKMEKNMEEKKGKIGLRVIAKSHHLYDMSCTQMTSEWLLKVGIYATDGKKRKGGKRQW